MNTSSGEVKSCAAMCSREGARHREARDVGSGGGPLGASCGHDLVVGVRRPQGIGHLPEIWRGRGARYGPCARLPEARTRFSYRRPTAEPLRSRHETPRSTHRATAACRSAGSCRPAEPVRLPAHPWPAPQRACAGGSLVGRKLAAMTLALDVPLCRDLSGALAAHLVRRFHPRPREPAPREARISHRIQPDVDHGPAGAVCYLIWR